MSSTLLKSDDPLIKSLLCGERCCGVNLSDFELKGAWPIAGSDDLPQELMQGEGPIGVVVREAYQTNFFIPFGPIFPMPEEERDDQKRDPFGYLRQGGLRAYVDDYLNRSEFHKDLGGGERIHMFRQPGSQVRYYWHEYNWEDDYTFGSDLYISEVTHDVVEKPFKYLKGAKDRLAFIGGQTTIDREFAALLMQGRIENLTDRSSDPKLPPAGVILLDPRHSSVVLDSTEVSFRATIMSMESGTHALQKGLSEGTDPHIALWKILRLCGDWRYPYAMRYRESWAGHEIIVSGDEDLKFRPEFSKTPDLVSLLKDQGFNARRMERLDFPLAENEVLNAAKGPPHLYMRAIIAAISTLAPTEFAVNFHPKSEEIEPDESAKEAWGIVTSGACGVVVNVARKS